MESNIQKIVGDRAERLSVIILSVSFFLFEAIFISIFSSVSYANVLSCGEQLRNPVTENNSNSDLDDLIALIEKDTGKNTEADNTPIVTSSKVVQKDYRSMNLNELLQSIGFTQHNRVVLAKLAAAEVLKNDDANTSSLKLKAEIYSFLEALTKDQLTDRQKLHFADYKLMIEQIIQRSMAVHRYKIMSESVDDINDAPMSFMDMYIIDSPTQQIVGKKPNFFVRLINLFRKKATFKDYKIPYENPEQFAKALLERRATERVEILSQQAKTMGLLSHLEIYHILTTIPAESQARVYQLLKPNLIGRIDFYPMVVLKIAADVNSEALLDIIPIQPKIILNDIRETGKNLNIFEVYDFLKSLNFKAVDISSALTDRKLSIEDFISFIEKQESPLPLDEALIFGGLLIQSNDDQVIIERGRAFLKTIFSDQHSQDRINNFFNLEIKRKTDPNKALNSKTVRERASSTPSNSTSEKTQMLLLKEFGNTEWEGRGNQGHRLKVIDGLRRTKPTSDYNQEQRIKILSTALNSYYHNIRDAAAAALNEIALNEQDAFTQETLLKFGKFNWDDSYNAPALSMIKMAENIIPVNEYINQLRIKYLNTANLSYYNTVKRSASEVLCSISSCDKLSEEDQIILIQELSKVEWSTTQDHYNILNAIASLKNIRPLSDIVQELRIKSLGKALRAYKLEIKNTTADALYQIAKNEQDEFTQELILKHCTVDWNATPSIYHSIMIKLVLDMKPANQFINELKIKFLGNAKNSYYDIIKERATEALCTILSCKSN